MADISGARRLLSDLQARDKQLETDTVTSTALAGGASTVGTGALTAVVAGKASTTATVLWGVVTVADFATTFGVGSLAASAVAARLAVNTGQ